MDMWIVLRSFAAVLFFIPQSCRHLSVLRFQFSLLIQDFFSKFLKSLGSFTPSRQLLLNSPFFFRSDYMFSKNFLSHLIFILLVCPNYTNCFSLISSDTICSLDTIIHHLYPYPL